MTPICRNYFSPSIKVTAKHASIELHDVRDAVNREISNGLQVSLEVTEHTMISSQNNQSNRWKNLHRSWVEFLSTSRKWINQLVS